MVINNNIDNYHIFGKFLANAMNGSQFANFFLANMYRYSETTENFRHYMVATHQNLLLPKFSHICGMYINHDN